MALRMPAQSWMRHHAAQRASDWRLQRASAATQHLHPCVRGTGVDIPATACTQCGSQATTCMHTAKGVKLRSAAPPPRLGKPQPLRRTGVSVCISVACPPHVMGVMLCKWRGLGS